MEKYAQFREDESEGKTTIIAVPKNESDEPTRIEGNWLDHTNSGLEDTVRSVLHDRIISENEIIDEYSVAVSREAFIESLQTARVGKTSTVTDNDTAEAVLEYFISESVFSNHKGSILILHDPRQFGDLTSSTTEYRCRCWAAAMASCLTFLDNEIELIERIHQGINQRYIDRSVNIDNSGQNEFRLIRQAERLKTARDVQEDWVLELREEAIFSEYKNIDDRMNEIVEMVSIYDNCTPLLDLEEVTNELDTFANCIKEIAGILADGDSLESSSTTETPIDADELKEAVDQTLEEIGDNVADYTAEEELEIDDSDNLSLE